MGAIPKALAIGCGNLPSAHSWVEVIRARKAFARAAKTLTGRAA
jgi:hypothetical protein